MAKRPKNETGREDFERVLRFCITHPYCPSTCPAYKECNGSYDMLYKTFNYIEELKKENERLKSEKEL